jgi:hypothetical protein
MAEACGVTALHKIELLLEAMSFVPRLVCLLDVP